jgi:hypothetical protein
MKVSDFDVLAWVWEQRKVSQIMGVLELLDFTTLQPSLACVLKLTNRLFI